MTTSLPALPSLEQLKHQAKDLVKRFRAQDPDAVRRVQSYLPRAAQAPADSLSTSGLTLSEAQLVIAREYGFSSWPRLKRHVDTVNPDHDTAVEQFKKAVYEHDSARLKSLIHAHPALKAEIDAPIFHFNSPAILQAASHKDRQVLDVLLENGADINARSKWWAGSFGVLPHSDPEFGAYLIERGAVVDVWAAAGMNRLDRLRELIQSDPSLVNARGGDGQGPLHFAASVDVARFLLDHGADIDMRDIDHGGTPAQWMAGDRPEVCRFLISRGAEIDIFMAVQLGDIELVRRALAEDPDSLHAHVGRGKLTSGDSQGGHIYVYTLGNGRSPLFLAAELDHGNVYRLLMERSSPVERLLAACWRADEQGAQEIIGGQPNIVRTLPPDQVRAIADAAWSHRTEAVRLMLKLGFDIEALGDNRSTALNRAAVRGYADVIELLLANGASQEAMNEFGGKPLPACLWGSVNFRDPDGDYVASVEKLLAAGAPLADVRYPCDNKPINAVLRRHLEKLARISIIAAIRLGSESRTAALLERDPGLANRRSSDMLPLYEAVRVNQPDIVRMLLSHGADLNLKEEPDGPMVLDAAVQAGRTEIVEVLRG